MISPLAYVDPRAQLGNNVEIRPFAYVEGDVVIGDDCVIMPYASLLNGTRMGARNVVHQNAVICAEPQSFRYVKGTPTRVEIGDDNVIRENVVIAGSNSPTQATRIGSHCHLMHKVHLCHDVQVGNHCVLGISASMMGASSLGDYAILSSSTMVQRCVRVGQFSLLQSGCRVAKDVMPFAIFGGNPAMYQGVNTTVMQKGLAHADERLFRHLANAFRIVTAGNFSLDDAVLKIAEQIEGSAELQALMDFITTASDGVIRLAVKED